MTATTGTYYKALTLLVVFGLNTAVSFACSLSELFHNFHHHNGPVKIEPAHDNSHNHSHGKPHKHSHSTAHSHNHDEAFEEKKDHDRNNSDDCCSNSVVEMQQVDKSISRSIDVPSIVFATSFLAAYYQPHSYGTQQKALFPDNVRWRHPTTIQDLRIVIQSFQI